MSPEEVAAALKALGVREGGVLLVHTSYRAVRPVDGGPAGLIAALRLALGERGTLLMPTMTDGASVFDPARTPSVGMGVVAETFWRRPGVLRSAHPGASFAAEGPCAGALCAPHPLAPPHGIESPVGRAYALDGQVLLLGVTQSENTTLHLAESLFGVPYSVSHPCVTAPGVVEMIPETDHCCVNFRKADAWLEAQGALGRGVVGRADARLMGARAVVEVARSALAVDPLVFLCASGCEECALARASVR